MAIIAGFFNCLFIYFLFPFFVLVVIGKPLFIMKAINSILTIEEPIKKFQINTILILIFLIGIGYSVIEMNTSRMAINYILQEAEHYDPKEYEEKLRVFNSNERNLFMVVSCLLILLTIQKFSDRHIKIGDYKREVFQKKAILDKEHPKVPLDEKKKQ